MHSRKLNKAETLKIKKRILELGTTHSRQAMLSMYSREHFSSVINRRVKATRRFFQYMESIGIPPEHFPDK